MDEASTLSEQLNQSSQRTNSTMQEVIMQNCFLQDFGQRMLAKYTREKSRCAALEQELNLTQVELARHKALLQHAEDKLQAASPSISQSSSNLHSALEAIKSELSSNSASKDTICSTLFSHISKAESECEKLRLECEYYKKEFEQIVLEKTTSVQCRFCKKAFIPMTNSFGACVYHPGKLHYYSCLGCGCDAYHTCCNRCGNCSPGCRTGSHVGL